MNMKMNGVSETQKKCQMMLDSQMIKMMDGKDIKLDNMKNQKMIMGGK